MTPLRAGYTYRNCFCPSQITHAGVAYSSAKDKLHMRIGASAHFISGLDADDVHMVVSESIVTQIPHFPLGTKKIGGLRFNCDELLNHVGTGEGILKLRVLSLFFIFSLASWSTT